MSPREPPPPKRTGTAVWPHKKNVALSNLREKTRRGSKQLHLKFKQCSSGKHNMAIMAMGGANVVFA
eukprot:337831-Pelagomonas_calceolata.AAC.1